MNKLCLLLLVILFASCKKDATPAVHFTTKFEVSLSSQNDLAYQIMLNDRVDAGGGSIKSAYYYFTPRTGDVFKIHVIYKDTISVIARYGDEIINTSTVFTEATNYGYDEKQGDFTYTVK